VDVRVKPVQGENQWDLVDLLGRSMGRIAEHPAKRFTIHPDGQALETMDGINRGPFESLDAALSEIETHTRGVCRLDEGSIQ
jgi:hypothetical protein